MITTKRANLLDATEDYIVQQCCCTSVKPSGLSAAIAERWASLNPYASRRRLKYNWAMPEDRPRPGTIQVLEHPERRVICIFGQYAQGKPGAYKDAVVVPDTAEDRLTYFKQGLAEIAARAPQSVAFPYKIGCGLAGGNWKAYEAALQDWAKQNPSIRVSVYQL